MARPPARAAHEELEAGEPESASRRDRAPDRLRAGRADRPEQSFASDAARVVPESAVAAPSPPSAGATFEPEARFEPEAAVEPEAAAALAAAAAAVPEPAEGFNDAIETLPAEARTEPEPQAGDAAADSQQLILEGDTEAGTDREATLLAVPAAEPPRRTTRPPLSWNDTRPVRWTSRRR